MHQDPNNQERVKRGQIPGMPQSPYGVPPPAYGPPQGPYGRTPNPYGIPSYGPPPPVYPQRRSRKTALLIIGIGLTLLLSCVGLSTLLAIIGSAPQTTTSTVQDIYNKTIQGSPVLDDPLNSTKGEWDNQSLENGSCSFSVGKYIVSDAWINYYTPCLYHANQFSDFVYQVQMTITKGDGGGILFRVADAAKGKSYRFLILEDGNYSLAVSTEGTGKNDRILQNGNLTMFNTGLNQTNMVAVAAKGNDLYLYVNGQFITRVSDSTYRSGAIGVFAAGPMTIPTEVVFTNAKIWNL